VGRQRENGNPDDADGSLFVFYGGPADELEREGVLEPSEAADIVIRRGGLDALVPGQFLGGPVHVAAGDFNDDGEADLAVGLPLTERLSATGWPISRSERGAVYVYWSVAERGSQLVLARPEAPDLGGQVPANVVLAGASQFAQLGAMLPGGGLDLDGDGIDDLAIGSDGADRLYVIRGAAPRVELPDEATVIMNSALGDYLVDRETGQPEARDGELAAGQIERWYTFTTLGDGEVGNVLRVTTALPEMPQPRPGPGWLPRVAADLYDGAGRRLVEGAYIVDMRSLEAGTYFLRVRTPAGGRAAEAIPFTIEISPPHMGFDHAPSDRDRIRGGDGEDVLVGGGDPDELHGDSGVDTFFGRSHETRDVEAAESYPASVPPTAGPHSVVSNDPQVLFAADGLLAAVASALGIPVTESYTGEQRPARAVRQSQVASLIYLDASGWDISSLAGLEAAVNLRALKLADNHVAGPGAVPSGLVHLESLDLSSNGITSLTPDDLADLPALKHLFLDDNEIADLGGLIGTYIIDDGAVGYSETGAGWQGNLSPYDGPFDSDYRFNPDTLGAASAQYDFTDLPAGQYDVQVTWPEGVGAGDAFVTVQADGGEGSTYTVNQRLAPGMLGEGEDFAGRPWQRLGTVTTASGQVAVEINAAAATDITADRHNTQSVALGDVDGDGDSDYLATGWWGERLYLNNGTSSPFAGVESVDLMDSVNTTISMALGDVDGDGKLDLVAGSKDQANCLYLNNGTRDPFAGVTGLDITTDAHYTLSMALGDVDGDSDLDLVVGDPLQTNRLYLNNGTVDPFAPTRLATGYDFGLYKQLVAGYDRVAEEGDELTFTADVAPGIAVDSYLWHVTADNGETIPDGTEAQFVFTPAEPGIYHVELTAARPGESDLVDAFDVYVKDVPLSVGIVPAAEGPAAPLAAAPAGLAEELAQDDLYEGDEVALSASVIDDSLTYDWRATNASEHVVAEQNGQGEAFSGFTFVLPDEGDYTVRLIVTEPGGGSTTAVETFHAENVAPEVSVEATFAVPGLPVTVSGSFFDPGEDFWLGEIDYGDGTARRPVFLDRNEGTSEAEHVYARAGQYTIRVTVDDGDDGGEGVGELGITVAPLASVSAMELSDGSPMKSKVDSIAFTFTGDVQVSQTALALHCDTTGEGVALPAGLMRYDPIACRARWDLRSLNLPCGIYTATLLADEIADVAARPLDGDADGSPGGNHAASFMVAIPGDATLDGQVDDLDFLALCAGFGGTEAQWQYGDFDGNGVVDHLDYLLYKAHAGQSVMPPQPPEVTPGSGGAGSPAPSDQADLEAEAQELVVSADQEPRESTEVPPSAPQAGPASSTSALDAAPVWLPDLPYPTTAGLPAARSTGQSAELSRIIGPRLPSSLRAAAEGEKLIGVRASDSIAARSRLVESALGSAVPRARSGRVRLGPIDAFDLLASRRPEVTQARSVSGTIEEDLADLLAIPGLGNPM